MIDANQNYEISVKLNHNIEIECTAVGYPVENITWSRQLGLNTHYLTADRLNTFSFNVSSILSLKNMLRNDSGNYSCELPYRSQKKIFNIKVQSVPSQPVITEIRLEPNDIIKLLWYLADTGGSRIQNIILEWSANFTSFTSDISNLTIQLDAGSHDTHRQMYATSFKFIVPEDSAIRIVAENCIGKSPSSEFKELPSRYFSADRSQPSMVSVTSVKVIASVFSVLLLVIAILAFLIRFYFYLKINSFAGCWY